MERFEGTLRSEVFELGNGGDECNVTMMLRLLLSIVLLKVALLRSLNRSLAKSDVARER